MFLIPGSRLSNLSRAPTKATLSTTFLALILKTSVSWCARNLCCASTTSTTRDVEYANILTRGTETVIDLLDRHIRTCRNAHQYIGIVTNSIVVRF